MKKTVKLIAALCLMAALVLTLAACGDKDPVGTWECTNYKDLVIDAAVAQGIDRAQIEELLLRWAISTSLPSLTRTAPSA